MEVFSTAFLPNIAYFQHVLIANQPILDLGEHFIKQTHRNRSFILSSNGVIPIIIPIRKKSEKSILATEISYAEDWQTKSLRAIQSCYKNAPYYEHYQVDFENLLMNQPVLLHHYNSNIFNWLCKELDVDVQFECKLEYVERTFQNDYRNMDFYKPESQLNSIYYKQVFENLNGFIPNLSVIDLLFNKGPEALPYLKDQTV